MLKAVTGLVADGCHMHGLAWTVDCTVGIDGCLFMYTLVGVIVEVAIDIHLRTETVVIGRGKHVVRTLLILAAIDGFALFVGGQRGIDLVFAEASTAGQSQLCVTNRLSGSGIDHHIAQLVVVFVG